MVEESVDRAIRTLSKGNPTPVQGDPNGSYQFPARTPAEARASMAEAHTGQTPKLDQPAEDPATTISKAVKTEDISSGWIC